MYDIEVVGVKIDLCLALLQNELGPIIGFRFGSEKDIS